MGPHIEENTERESKKKINFQVKKEAAGQRSNGKRAEEEKEVERNLMSTIFFPELPEQINKSVWARMLAKRYYFGK